MISVAVLMVAVSVSELPGEDRYGRAHQLERGGRHADAMRVFEEIAESDSPLRHYASVRASVNRGLAGDDAGALEWLSYWFEALPDGPWKSMAGFEYGRLLQKAKMHEKAIVPLTAALNPDLNLWWQEDIRWAIQESQFRVADFAPEGQQYFRQAAISATWVRQRVHAAEFLAELGDRESKLMAVDTLLQYAKYPKAMESIAELKATELSRSDEGPQLAWLEARALLGMNRRAAGYRVLEQLADAHIGHLWEARALRSLVGELVKRGDYKRAEGILERLSSGHPTRDETLSAHLRVAEAYKKGDNGAQAIRHLTYVHTAAPEHAWADDSLLTVGWIHARAARPDAAQEVWDQLLTRFPESPLRIETAFHLGELHRSENRKEQALERFRQAGAWGMTDYYGYRAAQRLREYREAGSSRGANLDVAPRTRLVRPMPSNDPVPDPVLPSLGSDVRFQRLKFFAWRGLPEAEWESSALLNESLKMQNPLSIYMAMGESGTAYSAMQMAASQRFGVNADGTQTAARLRVRYPRAYWEYVRELAKESGVDAYLILSIARQESTYRPALTSHAGATGVLQLMPDTAEWLAEFLTEIDRKHTRNLQDPTNSFRLGTYYLKYLMDKYDGNLVYALAAYNGGPGNVDKWLRSYRKLPLDGFVEKIPFTETRNYVKRVLAHWATYHSLYPKAN